MTRTGSECCPICSCQHCSHLYLYGTFLKCLSSAVHQMLQQMSHDFFSISYYVTFHCPLIHLFSFACELSQFLNQSSSPYVLSDCYLIHVLVFVLWPSCFFFQLFVPLTACLLVFPLAYTSARFMKPVTNPRHCGRGSWRKHRAYSEHKFPKPSHYI